MKKLLLTLRQAGLRVTPQRQAVLKLLEGNVKHPSAENIHHELLNEYPRISLATVYNILSKLAEGGKIQVLDVDPNRKRFDPCIAPHHHFYCKLCGEVFDIDCDAFPAVEADASTKRNIDGHRVDSIQVNLQGVCKHCGKCGEAG